MKKWTIRILVLLFLLTGSACSQSVPPAEGEEETLLVKERAAARKICRQPLTLWFPPPRRWTPSGLQMRPLWEIPCR